MAIGPGPEKKAELKGAGVMGGKSAGSVVGPTNLAKAVGHLKAEHPIKHDDLGPHQGQQNHVRHMKLAGCKPGGAW